MFPQIVCCSNSILFSYLRRPVRIMLFDEFNVVCERTRLTFRPFFDFLLVGFDDNIFGKLALALAKNVQVSGTFDAELAMKLFFVAGKIICVYRQC